MVRHRRPQQHPRRHRQQAQQGDQRRLADLKIKARLADLGAQPLSGSPADFGNHVSAETEKWAKVIRAANIKPDS